VFRNDASATDALASKKSPAKTASCLPTKPIHVKLPSTSPSDKSTVNITTSSQSYQVAKKTITVEKGKGKMMRRK
jgi:cytoskeletal protein RodZ